MSTIVSFMPMNLRLYDSEERDLRTYVSPLFTCALDPDDAKGACTHIVADNGGGKSTLLLFLELLFCKSGSSYPHVGGKRAIDYLRRAAGELKDTTPTTFAALVRRDDSMIMRAARDTIFGYTVALRGEAQSLDLRRFVIPLAECPGMTLERLARECVYDRECAPLPMSEVWSRLRELEGCHTFDSSDWESYARLMAEAGVSPILWRELARMNANEEAAGAYFQSKDAFRNIVGLIHESLQPTSGERAKDLSEVATDVARQVASQGADRERRKASDDAAQSIEELADRAMEYADRREDLKRAEDDALATREAIRDRMQQLSALLRGLDERAGSFKQRRLENRILRVSDRIRRGRSDLREKEARASTLSEAASRAAGEARAAKKDVILDEASESRRRSKRLQRQIEAKQKDIKVLVGEMEQDEKLVAAREQAWRALGRAIRTSDANLKSSLAAKETAVTSFVLAQDDASAADDAYAEACESLGVAKGALSRALNDLTASRAKVKGATALQESFDGFFSPDDVDALARAAIASRREAAKAHEAALSARGRASDAFEAARRDEQEAQFLCSSKEQEAQAWAERLESARERFELARRATALWDDVCGCVAEGRYAPALDLISAKRNDAVGRASRAGASAEGARERLEALQDGRLDMSASLRAWLDRHGVKARTLASHAGIPAQDRDRLFEGRPWLAHALVVDEEALATLLRASSEDTPSDLGHPIFYVRQTDVHRLMEGSGEGDPSDERLHRLVEALETIDRAYLDDPEGYEAELRGKEGEALREEREANDLARKLEGAHAEVLSFAAHLRALGLGDEATFADVEARYSQASCEAADANRRSEECRLIAGNAVAALKGAENELERASDLLEEAVENERGTSELRKYNDACVSAKSDFDRAKKESESLQLAKEAAVKRVDLARAEQVRCDSAFSAAEKQRDGVALQKERLESLSPDGAPEQRDPKPEEPCSLEELAAVVSILEGIVSESREELEAAQSELDNLREQMSSETRWQAALRGDNDDHIALTIEEIDAWVPRDVAERAGLRRRVRETVAAMQSAQGDARVAENEAELARGRLEDLSGELARLGLDEPLEVPAGYDYDARERVIDAEEQDDREARTDASREQEHLSSLLGRVSDLCGQLARRDGYRAAGPPSVPENLGELGPHVSDLEARSRAARESIGGARDSLARAAGQAADAARAAREQAAGRGVEEAAMRLEERCADRDEALRVVSGLRARALQFKKLAETLRHKLRATDESVEALLERAVDESYQLVAELHRLVLVSQVRIGQGRRQPTIEFRSEGRRAFQEEPKREAVATERVRSYVSELLLNVLPSKDDSGRLDEAKRGLAPYELVYKLLGIKGVVVRYPVIRGGRSLSYEAARDASGSGSTGQKSAGQVLAFLALLRYLGKAGALSTETSVFVALENQFGKISSSKIIEDIKAVVDQAGMQLITVAGRELGSAYAMGDVVYTLYARRGSEAPGIGQARAMVVQREGEAGQVRDAIVDHYRWTVSFENARLPI